jgi:serine/threonine protein phosphatase PrpC
MKGRTIMQQHPPSPHERPLHIQVAGCSATGRLLQRNEDAFALYDLSAPEQAALLGKLYVLADATGSPSTGETASRIAIEIIPAVYYYQSKSASLLGRLQEAFFAAHHRIREFASLQPERSQMMTTCTAVLVKEMRLWIAHIGDSRAYLVHPDSSSQSIIERLTTDHSRVAAQVRAGDLALEQMRSSPQDRDILLRALGQSDEDNAYPDFIIRNISPGDALVLCSDGLWSALTEEQIASVVRSAPLQQACEELVYWANETGGDENISAIILSFS